MTVTNRFNELKSIIKELNYEKPNNIYNRQTFAYRSYCKWAADELFDYCMLNYNMPLTESVETFRLKMDEYSCRAKSKEASCMFSIAHDLASDVLDKLLFGE